VIPRALVHSRSNAALLQRAAAFLAEKPEHSEILVIAPTRAAANELAVRAFPAGCQGVHALTLTQLAAHLAAQPMGRLALAPISRLGMEALAARIIHAAASANQLPYFAPVAQTPGFARALAKTITELRLENVTPPGDLAQLLALYEQELVTRSVADLPMLLGIAAEEAEKSQHRFTRLPLVLLGVDVESASHERLLVALVQRSPSVLATATTGDDAIPALQRILGIAAENIDNTPPTATLDRVRAFLFSSDPPPTAPPDPALLFSAPGESFECVEIARRIRALAEDGTPFDRIAILLRNVDPYQPLVEEALRRAGVGQYVSRGAARPDPAGRAFLALLACASDGCSASRFAEYLSLGQTPPLNPDGSPQIRPTQWVPADDDDFLATFQAPLASSLPGPEPEAPAPLDVPVGWEKLLVDAAVIGGRDRWARRLRGLRAEFEAQRRDLEKDDDSHRAYIHQRIQQLERLEHFALPLIDALSSLPSAEKWAVWLDRLSELAQMSLRRPESVLSVLSELEPMREVGPASLDEVHDVLSERLGFLRAEPPKRRYGRVFVGSIPEARGRSFDVVFLPGLAEGLFPRRALEDPLLLDEQRIKLAAGLATALDTQDQRIARERMLLRSAAAAASQSLVVSYPRMDVAQSRARVPSFYALEVVRAAEGRLPSLREFEKRAARAASSRLDWPAPANPRDAIDDAEYDLAALHASLQLRGAAARGSARYLMQSNEALARSLRTRGRRWRSRWFDADGIVDPDAATLAALEAHRFANRGYSPSSLQQFAACPYRFILQAVYQFRPREEPAKLEQMDPLTRGALFHSVQFELFRELNGATPPRILDLADQVLDRVAARYEDDLAPAIPRVWKSEIENLRTDLRGWLQHVAASESSRESGWRPAHFEFGFGLATNPDRDPASTRHEAVILDGVRLRGSIDLIERHATNNTLRVTDHKTGKSPKDRPQYVGGGAILQPLLYALAAETLLGESVQSGRLFYCTQRGDFSDVDIPLNDESRGRLRRVLEIIDRSIEEGFLPAAPQTGACGMCDYSMVCGPYEETRVKRKPQDRLDPLIQIRHSP
jgi:ATP-dependent helicase/nuclease subunit B